MEEKNKNSYLLEGQTDIAIGDIITLIVGVGVAVLILIFVGVLGGQTYELQEANIDEIGGQINQQAVDLINQTNVSVGVDGIFDVTTIVNDSLDSNVTAGTDVTSNLTIFTTEGFLFLPAGGSSLNGATVNVTYQFGSTNISSAIKGSIVSSFSALETTGDFLPIIVLAVIIAVVLSLVLGFTQLGQLGGGSQTAL